MNKEKLHLTTHRSAVTMNGDSPLETHASRQAFSLTAPLHYFLHVLDYCVAPMRVLPNLQGVFEDVPCTTWYRYILTPARWYARF